MAISKKYKDKLNDLIKESPVISKQKLVEKLQVAPNWVSRNIEELISLGFILEKQSFIENKKEKLTHNLSDIKSFNYLLLKHYINRSYVDLGLVAPFLLESKEIQDSSKCSELIDEIDKKITEDNFDYFTFLKTIIECEDYLNPLHSTNFPINIIIYLKTLYDSIELLRPIEINENLSLIITNTFKDLFNLQPTEEQLQVVAKAINYASSSDINHKSVSIQADAGSSKSTSALVIQNILRVNLNPLIVAKTNKAISGMSNAKTISKFLQENVGLSTTKDTWEEKRLKAFQNKDSIPFLIVDESSQVGELERIILSTVCKKILFLGDISQCKPIHDRQAVNVIYLHSLKTQYRFFNSSMKIDDTCFQGLFSKYHKEKKREKLNELFDTSIKGYFNTFGYYEKEENKYILKNDYTESFNNYIDILKSYSNDNSIIIAYSQNAVDTINNIINEGTNFKIGSKVSLILNDYENNQYNGFQYRVLKQENKKYLCKSIETGEEYLFHSSWLCLSYAITTMSAQGSQWKYVLGIDRTSPVTELWTDRYVIITRASIEVSFLSSNGMDKNNLPVNPTFSPRDILTRFVSQAKEGNRNNTLYYCVQELNKINSPSVYYDKLYKLALDTQLPISEVNTIFNDKISNNLSLNSLNYNLNLRTVQYFTPVFHNGKTLKGSDRILTKEEALQYSNISYIAEELKNSNRIVIDCDSKETVKIFEQYLNKTESYVNEDRSSAHLVFTTDKVVPTKHKKDIDLLGNQKFSLRNIKENKVYNNLPSIELTQNILDLFNEL